MPYRRILCGPFLALCVTTIASAAQWNIVPGSSHDIELVEQSDFLQIRTTSSDPFIIGNLKDVQEDDVVLEFEFFCVSGVKHLQAFVGPPFTESRSCVLPPLPIAQGWTNYAAQLDELTVAALAEPSAQLRLDFGYQPNVRLQIRNVRLRPQNEIEQRYQAELTQQRLAKAQIADRLTKAWSTDWPYRIDAIEVDADHITLNGNLPRDIDPTRLRIREIPIWQSLGDPECGTVVDVPVQSKDSSSSWHAIVPRKADDHDRLHSRWQLVELDESTTIEFTPPQYLSSVSSSGSESNIAVRPRNQKGLAGVTLDQLDDAMQLGASAVTINLVLDSFVSDQPGPSLEPIDAPETDGTESKVYFNPSAFGHYDKLIQWSRKNDVVVSAICLVHSNSRTNTNRGLAHPWCDGGHYAMPDVTTPRGVAIYSHVIRRIAERYQPILPSRGGISNWIAHNEIDFHTVWTNMGRQPRQVVMDAYLRSMRILDHCVRQYDPHARVFASLTHHWNVPDDGGWDQLAPQEVLQTLARSSDLEGDFPWAVAYHPYAPNLFSPTAWGGPGISNDFDTYRITLQNIEVLDRFLHQESLLDMDGKPRGVLLSEQGFHTDSYNDESQQLQAASLLFAMDRVRSHPIIESFHYHRLTDAKGEGGLKVGLRTYADNENPLGKKKRSWDLFRDISTDNEAKWHALRKSIP